MAVHTVKLLKQTLAAEGTVAFHLERPGEFQYTPGQFVNLALINPPPMDEQGPTRAFSLASAPHEPELLVATRIRNSTYKQALVHLEPGAEIKLKGPYGDLTLHADSSRPAAMMAGGIGITPFRSMIRQAVHDRLPTPITLFYASRRLEDAPFLRELQELEREHRLLQLIPTMTNPNEAWRGETGHFTAAMLNKYVLNIQEPIFYIVGPPGMVTSTLALLQEIGVPKENLRSEEFPGYH